MNSTLMLGMTNDVLARARTPAHLLKDWTGRVASHALFDVACELYTNEEFEHAAVLFRYLLAFRTRKSAVWAWLGASLEAQGQSAEALLVYEGAVTALAAEQAQLASEGRGLDGRSAGLREARSEFALRVESLRRQPAAQAHRASHSTSSFAGGRPNERV